MEPEGDEEGGGGADIVVNVVEVGCGRLEAAAIHIRPDTTRPKITKTPPTNTRGAKLAPFELNNSAISGAHIYYEQYLLPSRFWMFGILLVVRASKKKMEDMTVAMSCHAISMPVCSARPPHLI